MRRTTAAIVFTLAFIGAADAEAKQWKYVGVHPLSTGVFCYIEAPHVHAIAPHRPKVLFRMHDDHYFFVGDPVAHDYAGHRHVYHGHHPIHVSVLFGDPIDHVEYCYLDGPHHHAFEPPPRAGFTTESGVFWYVGDMPPRYRRGRRAYGRINVVYAELPYRRPVVTVSPPRGYVDLHIVTPRVRVHAVPPHRRVSVRGSVGLHVPRPPVVGVGVGVQVGHRHDVVVHDRRPGRRIGHRKHGHKRRKHKHRGRRRGRR